MAQLPDNKRIPQLDGLRALAFLSVFLFHSAKLPSKMVLWAGVDLFFVLSGFLITGILLRSSYQPRSAYFGRFYWRRAKRILPPYVIATILAAMAFPIDLIHTWPWYAFFLSNVGQALGADIRSPMTSFWSLAVEEQFYLVWPAVIILFPPRILARVCWVGVLVIPVIRALGSPFFSRTGGIYLLTPFRSDLLLAGALIGLVWHKNDAQLPESWRRLAVPAMGGSLALYLVLCALSSFERDSNSLLFDSFGYSLILIFCSALFMAVLTLDSGCWLFRLFCYSPVAYVGRISYTMYLLHSTCIMASVKYLNAYSQLMSRSVALAATIGLSAISWKLVEKPLLDAGDRQVVHKANNLQSNFSSSRGNIA